MQVVYVFCYKLIEFVLSKNVMKNLEVEIFFILKFLNILSHSHDELQNHRKDCPTMPSCLIFQRNLYYYFRYCLDLVLSYNFSNNTLTQLHQNYPLELRKLCRLKLHLIEQFGSEEMRK